MTNSSRQRTRSPFTPPPRVSTVAAVAAVMTTTALLILLAVSPATKPARPSPLAPAAHNATANAGVVAQYGALPLAFEANAGQADAGARFVAHARGFALALSPDALTLVVGGRRSAVGSESTRHCAPSPTAPPLPTTD